MADTEIEPHYQKRAESIVDMLFEGKLFIDKLTRKDLQAIEDFLAYEIQAGINSALRLDKILERQKEIK